MSDKEVEDFLEHVGVKGMRWGVKNSRLPGVSRSTHKEANKDAKEFARAKQFTGEGAGNRRKHIKSTVESKKKKSSSYSDAFDSALSSQDMAKHVTKAQKERKHIDKSNKTKKTIGAVARRVTGEPGTQAALVGLVFAGAAYAKTPKGQATMQKGLKKITSLANEAKRKKGAYFINKLING